LTAFVSADLLPRSSRFSIENGSYLLILDIAEVGDFLSGVRTSETTKAMISRRDHRHDANASTGQHGRNFFRGRERRTKTCALDSLELFVIDSA